jgi:hypothetical protein
MSEQKNILNQFKTKFGKIFNKEEIPKFIIENKSSPSPTRTKLQSSSEKKHKFSIEEDGENQVYNYNLDDDDEYEDNPEESNPEQPDDTKNENNINSTNKTQSFVNSDQIEENDIHTFSHQLYLKGHCVDLENLNFTFCYKMKENIGKKIYSFLGIDSPNGLQRVNYIALLDEYFLYFIKDILIDNKHENVFLRKCGNYHDLRLLNRVEVKTIENQHIKFTLNFTIDKSFTNYKSKIKEICFDKLQGEKFRQHLKLYLAKINNNNEIVI